MQISPKLEQVASFMVSGITVRTINSDEINPATAKLGKHWERFCSEGLVEKIPSRQENSPIYGVYSAYESDVNGHYSSTAGVAVSAEAKQADFTTLVIAPGKYLVFEAEGIMPQVVIDIWQAIWTFFQINSHVQRKYATDFECYQGAEKVAVYIGIK